MLHFWRQKYNTWNTLEVRNLLFPPALTVLPVSSWSAARVDGKAAPGTFTCCVPVTFNNKGMESWRKLSSEFSRCQHTTVTQHNGIRYGYRISQTGQNSYWKILFLWEFSQLLVAVPKVNALKLKKFTSHTNQPAMGPSIHSRMNSSSKQNHKNKNTKCLKEGWMSGMHRLE